MTRLLSILSLLAAMCILPYATEAQYPSVGNTGGSSDSSYYTADYLSGSTTCGIEEAFNACVTESGGALWSGQCTIHLQQGNCTTTETVDIGTSTVAAGTDQRAGVIVKGYGHGVFNTADRTLEYCASTVRYNGVSGNPVFSVFAGNHMTFRDFCVDGDYAGLGANKANYGFDVQADSADSDNSNNITFERMSVSDTSDAAWRIGDTLADDSIVLTRITGSNIVQPGDYCVAVYSQNANSTVIDHTTCNRWMKHGVYVYDGHVDVSNSQFLGAEADFESGTATGGAADGGPGTLIDAGATFGTDTYNSGYSVTQIVAAGTNITCDITDTVDTTLTIDAACDAWRDPTGKAYLVHYSTVSAIYLDDGADGVTIRGNDFELQQEMIAGIQTSTGTGRRNITTIEDNQLRLIGGQDGDQYDHGTYPASNDTTVEVIAFYHGGNLTMHGNISGTGASADPDIHIDPTNSVNRLVYWATGNDWAGSTVDLEATNLYPNVQTPLCLQRSGDSSSSVLDRTCFNTDSTRSVYFDYDADNTQDASEPFILAGNERHWYEMANAIAINNESELNGAAPVATHYFSSAAGGDYVVGADANDPCTAVGTPCQSLSKASSICGNGDICIFDSGDTWDVLGGQFDDGLQLNPSCANVADVDGPCIIIKGSDSTGATRPTFDSNGYVGASTASVKVTDTVAFGGWVVVEGIEVNDGAGNAPIDAFSASDYAKMMVINSGSTDITPNALSQVFTPHDVSSMVVFNGYGNILAAAINNPTIISFGDPSAAGTVTATLIGTRELRQDDATDIVTINPTATAGTSKLFIGEHMLTITDVHSGIELNTAVAGSTVTATLVRTTIRNDGDAAAECIRILGDQAGAGDNLALNVYDVSCYGMGVGITTPVATNNNSTIAINGRNLTIRTRSGEDGVSSIIDVDDANEYNVNVSCSDVVWDPTSTDVITYNGTAYARWSEAALAAEAAGSTRFFWPNKGLECVEPYAVTLPETIPSWFFSDATARSVFVLNAIGGSR